MSSRVLTRACLAVLVGLCCLIRTSAAGPDDWPCPPNSVQTVAAQEKIRPMPSGPAPKVPASPFPPANGALTRPTPNDPAPPCVAVRVRVPAEVSPGQELTYQIVAENVSGGEAHHVTVKVPLPVNAKYVRATPAPTEKEPLLVWKLGTLRGSEKKEIRLVAVPTGDGEISCCARVQYEHGQCVKTKLARPGVQIKKSGPVEGAKDDLLKFKIEVSNTSKVPAKNVVVEETLPAGLEFSNSKPSTTGENPLVWKLGDLEPGQSRVVEYDAIASSLGSLKTAALVKADGGVKREASHAVKIGEPALAVVKLGPKHRLVGRPAVYQLTVRNTGTLPATHVDLEDELPPEIEFMSATAGGRLEREHVKWSLGTIAPGASRTVQVTVRATKAGLFKNVSTVTGDRGLSEQGKAETRFDLPTGLSMEIDKGDEPVTAGQSASWTLRLMNRGKSNESNVGAILRLPEGVTAVEVRGIAGAQIKDGKVVVPALAALTPGRDEVALIRLKAEQPGEHRVLAEVFSDRVGPDAAVKVEETLTVAAGGATTRTSHRPGPKGRERATFTPGER